MAKKKKFIILPRNERIFMQGLTTGRGHRRFKKPGAMWITDEGEAREIDYRRMDNTHHYTFSGVDMTGIRTTRDNGYVWVRRGVKQVRVKRDLAISEGWEIVSPKPERVRAEVNHATDPQ
jgi:hypothetical protein